MNIGVKVSSAHRASLLASLMASLYCPLKFDFLISSEYGYLLFRCP